MCLSAAAPLTDCRRAPRRPCRSRPKHTHETSRVGGSTVLGSRQGFCMHCRERRPDTCYSYLCASQSYRHMQPVCSDMRRAPPGSGQNLQRKETRLKILKVERTLYPVTTTPNSGRRKNWPKPLSGWQQMYFPTSVALAEATETFKETMYWLPSHEGTTPEQVSPILSGFVKFEHVF